jgi:hypothetical protein
MKIFKHWAFVVFLAVVGITVGITACNNEILSTSTSEQQPPPSPKSVQEVLDEAETVQLSAFSTELISASYDPGFEYVVLTYKVGTIKDMFLQYLSKVVVAGPGLEFTYSEIVGHSETKQVENINSLAVNFNASVWVAGATASASLFSFNSLGPEASAVAAAGKLSFDRASVTTTRYTHTYQEFLFVENSIKQDMSVFPAGKKYALAAFADVGIYQFLKYDPQTKTASAIPGTSLWFNVESEPYWGIYEFTREAELSIPQQLIPFEKVNVEIKEEKLEKSQTITFDVGSRRVPDNSWYKTDWEPITLVLPLLRELGYKTVAFEWKTYWAEKQDSLTGWPDCTAHVVLDCADIKKYRENGWSYYDQVVNPGDGWKWATWNFSAPIGTVADRPYIRCAYGYDKQDLLVWAKAWYELSEKVTVTVTAQK